MNNGNELIIYYKVGIQVWASMQSIIIAVLIKKKLNIIVILEFKSKCSELTFNSSSLIESN